MKTLLIGAVMIGAIAGQLAAQANLSGGLAVLSPGGAVLVPGPSSSIWWDDPSCGRQAQVANHGDRAFRYWGYACDPFYGDNGYPTPGVTLATPQVVAPLQPVPAPAPPARSELREYHWPSSGSNSTTATFSIVGKDGRVESASMVWVQDNTLCYIAPDGSEGRIPIDAVDRNATHQRNAEKQVSFWLPAESQTGNTADRQVAVSPPSAAQ